MRLKALNYEYKCIDCNTSMISSEEMILSRPESERHLCPKCTDQQRKQKTKNKYRALINDSKWHGRSGYVNRYYSVYEYCIRRECSDSRTFTEFIVDYIWWYGAFGRFRDRLFVWSDFDGYSYTAGEKWASRRVPNYLIRVKQRPGQSRTI